MNILLTGGAGYIGTHTALALIEAGHSVVVVDNLSNSSKEALKRTEQIAAASIPFYEIDVRDEIKLREVFDKHAFNGVIHFAGLKAVGESVEKPLDYYDNNLSNTLTLLRVMREYQVGRIVFSSSATVYGDPSELPLRETSQVGVGLTNPYGWTKFMNEQILTDTAHADNTLAVTILRYFNPVGAHPSGLIGEDPKDVPNNIMPYLSQTAVGKRKLVSVFGGDYDTLDGTGVRDYIHVLDLATGHVAALEHSKPGTSVYNLGSGRGVSVLELIDAFSKASGRTIPYEIVARRPGDIASCYATAEKAERELGWSTQYTIEDACRDSWNWQSKNPDGYKSAS